MVIEPGNNVNSTSNSASKTRQGNVRADSSAKSSSTGSAGTDNVSLSDAGQSLARLEHAVADAPDVDADRVAQIKAALQKGQYQVDAYRLAGKMLAQDDL